MNRSLSFRLAAAAVLLANAPPATAADLAEPPAFDAVKLAAIDGAMAAAIREKKIPGGVVWIERGGRAYRKAYGYRAVDPAKEAAKLDTIYDSASLTKVIATAPSIMILEAEGKIDLDDKVSKYLPEFTGGGKEKVRIEQLLCHTSGALPGIPREPDWGGGYEAGVKKAVALPLKDAPGSRYRYCDTNFILLGEIVRMVSGKPVDQFAAERVFAPLGMADTGFNPSREKRNRIAPTEREGGTVIRGVVHDPTARRMDGVAGHAGMFTTAEDLAKFARMMLGGGEYGGKRILPAKSVREMTDRQTPRSWGVQRGYGWEIHSYDPSPRGEVFPLGKSYGHTGWTGGSS